MVVDIFHMAMMSYSRLIARLKKIFPIRTNMMERYIFRDVEMKRLVIFLHKITWDDDLIDENIENIKFYEKLGFLDFKYLIYLEEMGKLDKFIGFIKNVAGEKISEIQDFSG